MGGTEEITGCRGGNERNGCYGRYRGEEGERSGPRFLPNPHHRCILIAKPSAAPAEERFSPQVA